MKNDGPTGQRYKNRKDVTREKKGISNSRAPSTSISQPLRAPPLIKYRNLPHMQPEGYLNPRRRPHLANRCECRPYVRQIPSEDYRRFPGCKQNRPKNKQEYELKEKTSPEKRWKTPGGQKNKAMGMRPACFFQKNHHELRPSGAEKEQPIARFAGADASRAARFPNERIQRDFPTPRPSTRIRPPPFSLQIGWRLSCLANSRH